MLAGRTFLLAAGLALPAQAQSGIWLEWLGLYVGAARFHGSLPLEDIYPPPVHPHVDREDPSPFAVSCAISSDQGLTTVWLRIDGGPMQTSEDGETLRFGLMKNGVPPLAGAGAHPAPRSASLTVQRDSLAIEALFNFADGSFWRRHFTIHFTPRGSDVIVWVFDAAGTRARTWRGSVIRQGQPGRGPM